MDEGNILPSEQVLPTSCVVGSNQAPATKIFFPFQQLLPTLQPSELTISISDQAAGQQGSSFRIVRDSLPICAPRV